MHDFELTRLQAEGRVALHRIRSIPLGEILLGLNTLGIDPNEVDVLATSHGRLVIEIRKDNNAK